MNSYDVRFWDIKKVGDTAKGRWRVRWAVAGRPHCKSFPARPLADGFLASLKDAVRGNLPFDPVTGLPATGQQQAAGGDVTWYEHNSGNVDSPAQAKRPVLHPPEPYQRRGRPSEREQRPVRLITRIGGSPAKRFAPRRQVPNTGEAQRCPAIPEPLDAW